MSRLALAVIMSKPASSHYYPTKHKKIYYIHQSDLIDFV